MCVWGCACSPNPLEGAGWTDLLVLADGGVWVTAVFSSLCFPKGGDGEAEAQAQASLSALRGTQGPVDKGDVDKTVSTGARFASVKQSKPCDAFVSY